MKVKEEKQKASLKTNIQKIKKTSSPITSGQATGETMETVTDFIFLGSKITEDSDCSHEIKRCLIFERKAMINLEGVLKSRDITLPSKVCVHAKSLQSCPALCNSVDYSLLGSSLHGILQARTLEWVAFPSPGALPNPEIKPTSFTSSSFAGGFFTTSTTWEAHL